MQNTLALAKRKKLTSQKALQEGNEDAATAGYATIKLKSKSYSCAHFQQHLLVKPDSLENDVFQR
jgi:hypothetical protein